MNKSRVSQQSKEFTIMKITWSSLPAHSCKPVASTTPAARRRPRTASAPPRAGGRRGRHPRAAPCSMVAREGPRSSVAPLSWWLAVSTPPVRRRCCALAGRRPPRHLLPGDRGGPPCADGPLPCGRRPPRRPRAGGGRQPPRAGDWEDLRTPWAPAALARRRPRRPPRASRRRRGLAAPRWPGRSSARAEREERREMEREKRSIRERGEGNG